MKRKIEARWFGLFGSLLLVVALLLPSGGAFAKEAKIAKNISVLEAYDMVVNPKSGVYLVDVRTPGEYQQIGHSAMAYNIPFMFLSDEFVEKGGTFRGKKMKKTRYQYYKNSDFLAYMKKHFKVDDTLLIMCRSGNRSVPASDLLAQNGFKHVCNVVGGFEGGKFKGADKREHELMKKYSQHYGRRGFTGGWKYYGLPWTYHMNPKLIYGPHKK